MVASPKYLKKQGAPKRPADLSGHETLIYSSVQGNDVWRVLSPRGEPVTVPVTGGCAPTICRPCWRPRARLGVAALPWYVAGDSLAAGAVVEVLGDSLPEQEIHAVFPSPKLVPRKVQAFVAFLQGRFGARWWETLPKA